MLIPLFLVGGLAVGSYAFLPSTWQKTRHRMGRRNPLAGREHYILRLMTDHIRNIPLFCWTCWQATISQPHFSW